VHRYAARPLRHAAGFLCLYLIWGEHTVAGLLGSGEMNGGSALQKLSLEKQSVLDEADLLLSDEEDYSEDTSVELGESMTIAEQVATSAGNSSASDSVVMPPTTSLSSEGQFKMMNADVTSPPNEYHSLNSMVAEFLQMRNNPGTADYIGPIANASESEFNHLWRRQYREVLCEAKAVINMDLCWTKTNLSGVPGVGSGGHHSDACDNLVKIDFKTKLFHNVSELTISQVNSYNSAYAPPGSAPRTLQNFDRVVNTCKVWYTNIEAGLGQLLTSIRQTQALCALQIALDKTSVNRDENCWRVIQVANAGVSLVSE